MLVSGRKSFLSSVTLQLAYSGNVSFSVDVPTSLRLDLHIYLVVVLGCSAFGCVLGGC